MDRDALCPRRKIQYEVDFYRTARGLYSRSLLVSWGERVSWVFLVDKELQYVWGERHWSSEKCLDSFASCWSIIWLKSGRIERRASPCSTAPRYRSLLNLTGQYCRVAYDVLAINLKRRGYLHPLSGLSTYGGLPSIKRRIPS